MDELGLYARAVLEGLRGPLEDGVVWIARSGGAISYPCRFSLVAAMNPCPCGFLDDADKPCRCGYVQLTNYASKLSGPLLDRFDMQVTMDRVGKDELLGAPDGDSSEVVRARVQACRDIQTERYGSALHTNATVPRPVLNAKLGLTASGRLALGAAMDFLALSGRGVDRVMRVARTIADLKGNASVSPDDIDEAIGYRVYLAAKEVAGCA